MAKPFAKAFYSSKTWQDCRDEYMKRAHHLCENCLRQGIYKPAEIVHHIIELDPTNINNPEITLNFNNLEAVCRECHKNIHGLDGGRWGVVNEKKRARRAASQRYKVGANGEIFPNTPPSGAQNSSRA